MNQEQLNKLIEDSFELHTYGDMSEVGVFLEELSDKYSLKFNNITFRNIGNSKEYFSRLED
tara:strand:+ start:2272 stop:2454 length:183 start_codon:yes stop_codon:yes gene_type:complete